MKKKIKLTIEYTVDEALELETVLFGLLNDVGYETEEAAITMAERTIEKLKSALPTYNNPLHNEPARRRPLSGSS